MVSEYHFTVDEELSLHSIMVTAVQWTGRNGVVYKDILQSTNMHGIDIADIGDL